MKDENSAHGYSEGSDVPEQKKLEPEYEYCKICDGLGCEYCTGSGLAIKKLEPEKTDVPKEKRIGYYWIRIAQWKDRDTRTEDKWSIGYWDGKCFEEFNEMYDEREILEIGEYFDMKEVAELRAKIETYESLDVLKTEEIIDLRAERDKLKEQIQTWHDNYDEHIEQFESDKSKLEADNERLKEELKNWKKTAFDNMADGDL